MNYTIKAWRLGDHSVYFMCDNCKDDATIRRNDGRPMSEEDVLEAIEVWDHRCSPTKINGSIILKGSPS